MNLDQIIEEEKGSEVDPFYVDDAVHDEKADEASKINNRGIRAQLEYLAGRGWSEAGIRDLLKDGKS